MASRLLRPSVIISSVCCDTLAQKFNRAANHVGVESAGQPAFAAHHQHQHALFRPVLQQRMHRSPARASRPSARTRDKRARVRTRGKSLFLRAPQPRGGHELHRAGDLLRIFYRTNAAL